VALSRRTSETDSVFRVSQFCSSCEPILFFLRDVDRDEESGADPLMGFFEIPTSVMFQEQIIWGCKKIATSLMMRLLANVGERSLRTACPESY
jgi:hypothetical protein